MVTHFCKLNKCIIQIFLNLSLLLKEMLENRDRRTFTYQQPHCSVKTYLRFLEFTNVYIQIRCQHFGKHQFLLWIWSVVSTIELSRHLPSWNSYHHPAPDYEVGMSLVHRPRRSLSSGQTPTVSPSLRMDFLERKVQQILQTRMSLW
jgi:hypothetical protein